MKKRLIILSLAVFALTSANAQQYYGNGYTIVRADDTKVGQDLNVVVYKSISANTVKGGLIQLLKGSGWSLADTVNSDPSIIRLYEQAYPDFKRTLNPKRLDDALQYIAGSAWDLVVDPVNKLVSFQLNQSYRCFTLREATCSVSPR